MCTRYIYMFYEWSLITIFYEHICKQTHLTSLIYKDELSPCLFLYPVPWQKLLVAPRVAVNIIATETVASPLVGGW